MVKVWQWRPVRPQMSMVINIKNYEQGLLLSTCSLPESYISQLFLSRCDDVADCQLSETSEGGEDEQLSECAHITACSGDDCEEEPSGDGPDETTDEQNTSVCEREGFISKNVAQAVASNGVQ